MPTAAFRFPHDVPVLTDAEVTLRAHRAGDIPRIVQFANDDRSRRFLPELPSPYGPAEGAAFVDGRAPLWQADPQHPVWAIDVDGQFAGSINLHPRGPQVWEIGYAAHPEVRGRGVVTTAARLVVDHAFGELDARSLAWRCRAGNFASWRVAWAAGFRFDGVWRGMHGGSRVEADDLWTGSLTVAEWTASRTRPSRAARPWWEPKVLRGERVVLRPFRDDEVPSSGPDELGHRFNGGAQPTPAEFPAWLRERRRRMAEGGGVYWCIADARTDHLMGQLNLQRLNDDFTAGTGRMGYWLLPEARGHGLIAEALDLLVPHAFAPLTDLAGVRDGLGLHRIYAGTDERNRASQRALRRAGFVECARERSVLAQPDGSASGAISFELLAADNRDAQRREPLRIPCLETDRLVLREWRASDAPSPQAGRADALAARFLPEPLPTTDNFEDWRAGWARRADARTGMNWCIVDRATNEVLGNIEVADLGEGVPGNGEIGYWLWPAARGHGYAGEAVERVVDWAFTEGGLTRLHAGTDIANLPSQRALRRAGFVEWGHDSGAFTVANGAVTDSVFFQLLSTDDRDAQRVEPRVIPVIESERLRLRPWRESDRPGEEPVNDPVAAMFMSSPMPTADGWDERLVRIRRGADAGTQLTWCIADHDTDEALGNLGLFGIDDRTADNAEVGYWLWPQARGNGYVQEAVRALVTWAFTDGGVTRLHAETDLRNIASQIALQRNGFRKWGQDRAAYTSANGEVTDGAYFELLRSDWEAGQSAGSPSLTSTTPPSTHTAPAS